MVFDGVLYWRARRGYAYFLVITSLVEWSHVSEGMIRLIVEIPKGFEKQPREVTLGSGKIDLLYETQM